MIQAKERLIRIMGTFDLATGHGDTMEELLDSLESELRDVLGHYREALKQEQGEPVGKFAQFTDDIWREVTDGSSGVLLYTHPKEWVGLTYKEVQEILLDPKFQLKPLIAHAVEAKLKEKNK